MAQISTGSSTAGKANVDSNFNLNVNTPTDEPTAGFTACSSQVDAGDVLGAPLNRALEVSPDFRLRVATEVPYFSQSFEGTIISRDRIQQNDTTMTCAQAADFLTLNSGSSVTSGQTTNIRTYRTFPLLGSFLNHAHLWVRETNPTATNVVSEWGCGYATGTATPTDGVFLRRISGGTLRAVINFGGTETIADLTMTNVPSRDGIGVYDATETNHWIIYIHNDDAHFWCNNVLVARIQCPAAQAAPSQSSALPLFARVNNTGAASAARQLGIGFLEVTQGDTDGNKPWADVMCGGGGGSYQVQPGTTSAQTANWANSAAPASATLSNTAAGYTTLGGQWQYAAVAGAETDFALFGYTNPAGTATLPGKTLYVTGVRIGETFVQGAAVATTTVLVWGVGVGSTAVSLATVDAAATVGPRRKMLGAQSLAAAAAIGALALGFERHFRSPIIVPPGAFFHVILKQPQGAATASLVFRGSVDIDGYFE